MGVEFDGENEMLAAIERRYGEQAMQDKKDRALRRGAEVFKDELVREFESFQDTGASVDEITVSDPLNYMGERAIRVYWEGPRNRRNIIHINEFGSVKNPSPAGKGAIARSLRSAQEAFKRVVREELGR